MRSFALVFLASLRLCRARQPGFSIHDDLLAHPQFEVTFDSYILETDALALVESKRAAHGTYTPDASQTNLAARVRESGTADAAADPTADSDDPPEVAETYEILTSPPSRYLCSVPTIPKQPELNQTANNLAKAEEARELTRANTRGWELMSALDGHCLFYVSGWWSYNFCYGKDIVQFHSVRTVPGGAPVKDPQTPEYVLGRAPVPAKAKKPSTDTAVQKVHGGSGSADPDTKGVAPPNTELQVKGDQRYLVQRLDGGTLCDLTGRPRTIEIQYHCTPGLSGDRIGWIKEITTCTYVMVVQTPRLCADVAFLPPKETRAYPISCRQIVDSHEEAAWYHGRTLEAAQEAARAADVAAAQARNSKEQIKGGKNAPPHNPFAGVTIGGVVLGAKRLLASQGGGKIVELTLPRGFATAKLPGTALAELAATLKKGDGAKMAAMSVEELLEMGIDAESIEVLRKELKMMGDDGWEIAVEVVPGTEDAADAGAAPKKAKAAGSNKGRPEQDDSEEEGSKETFYKEEL
ncbi:glucosidase II beta subunit-like protein-domain-containing protein [Podospora conica]|nr:glucosidase II beta subunit-like protein-domain-containing protein [Schizothecium conicum]